jgi:hypothetical protein
MIGLYSNKDMSRISGLERQQKSKYRLAVDGKNINDFQKPYRLSPLTRPMNETVDLLPKTIPVRLKKKRET